MIQTEAWVLSDSPLIHDHFQLELKDFRFASPAEDEALVRPLYGCWEGNMSHALRRSPLDLCRARNERDVVLGNAGIVEVVEIGGPSELRPGDRCIVFCNGDPDDHGYPRLIYGYDAPGTIGVMAKLTKLKLFQLIKIPESTCISLEQWAAFSLRYITAWANWHVASGCWRVQMRDSPASQAPVVAWGGGVSLAELTLARISGHPTAMIASRPSRISLIERNGITAIDRGVFSAAAYESDFLGSVRDFTDGQGAAIFVDNIGAHYRSTIKALSRQGVLTTSGWKAGVTFPVVRASECISRHIHVFTHYARRSEAEMAVAFAEAQRWAPPMPNHVWSWDDIPRLAAAYDSGEVDDYFPIFRIGEA